MELLCLFTVFYSLLCIRTDQIHYGGTLEYYTLYNTATKLTWTVMIYTLSLQHTSTWINGNAEQYFTGHIIINEDIFSQWSEQCQVRQRTEGILALINCNCFVILTYWNTGIKIPTYVLYTTYFTSLVYSLIPYKLDFDRGRIQNSISSGQIWDG